MDFSFMRRRRLRVLDLCCGAFGAGLGYARMGAEVVGVDIKRRRDLPNHPRLHFIQADVMDVVTEVGWLQEFDVVHASFPCQTHTRAKHLRDAQGKSTSKVDLIEPGRAALDAAGVPYILENVPGAPLREDLLLCGSMFPELHVYDATGRRWLQRHRVFEFSDLQAPPQPECRHRSVGVRPLGVYASKADNIPSGGQTARTLDEGRELMGIEWMSWAALIEAIPPHYTAYIAGHILTSSPIGG